MTECYLDNCEIALLTPIKAGNKEKESIFNLNQYFSISYQMLSTVEKLVSINVHLKSLNLVYSSAFKFQYGVTDGRFSFLLAIIINVI